MNFLYGFFLLFLFAGEFVKSQNDNSILEQLLSSETGYDSRTHPLMAEGLPVKINASMYVMDISSIDDFNQEFTMSYYFRLNWNDPRLEFPATDKIKRYLSPGDYDKIWKPDIFFIEERTGKLHSVLVQNSFLAIKPNGDARFSSKLTETFRCPMDLRSFPFDIQKCSFNIESYGYTSDQVELNWDKEHDSILVSDSIDVYNFATMDYNISKEVVSLTFASYQRLAVEFIFKRKVGLFLTKIYIPYIILIFVAWLSFWIKPKLMVLRLTLLLSVLAMMMYLSDTVMNYVPPASYTKGIDVWTAVCISLAFVAFLEFIIVSQLHVKKHKREKQQFKENLDQSCKNEALKTAEKEVGAAFSESCPDSSFSLMPRRNTRNLSKMIDIAFRVAFPALFGFFNLIYWPVYAA